MNKIRVDVAVVVRHNPDGSVRPLWIVWEDSRRFRVDRILQVCRAASLKGGGAGIRYTCEIAGKITYLWEECGIWFVERKEPSGRPALSLSVFPSPNGTE